MTKVEAIKRVATSKTFAIVTSSVLAATVSAVVTHRVLKNKLETQYAELASQEIQEAKKFYIQKYKDADEADLEKLASKYDLESDEVDPDEEVFGDEELAAEHNAIVHAAKIMEEQQYVQYNKPSSIKPVEEEVVVVAKVKRSNIFEKPFSEIDVEFDQGPEDQKKALGKPYILPEDDFMANEEDRSVSQLTYYEGDSVLADERDGIIDDIDRRLGGEDNLRFGYGSGDKNVVYINSPGTDSLYEVVRSPGSFAEEVYDMRPEDDEPEVLRMRKSEGY